MSSFVDYGEFVFDNRTKLEHEFPQKTFEERERMIQIAYIRTMKGNPNMYTTENLDASWVIVQAASLNHLILVKYLIEEFKVSVDARCEINTDAEIKASDDLDIEDNETALSVALREKYWNLAAYLMTQNADPTLGNGGSFPIMSAAAISNLRMFNGFMTYIVDRWRVNPNMYWDDEINNGENAAFLVTNYHALEWLGSRNRGTERRVEFWNLHDDDDGDTVLHSLARKGHSNFNEFVSDLDECRRWMQRWWSRGAEDPFKMSNGEGGKAMFESLFKYGRWNHLSSNDAIRMVRNVAILCDVKTTDLEHDIVDFKVVYGDKEIRNEHGAVIKHVRIPIGVNFQTRSVRDRSIINVITSFGFGLDTSSSLMYALFSICERPFLEVMKGIFGVTGNKRAQETLSIMMTMTTFASTRTIQRIGQLSLVRVLPEELLRKLKTMLI